MARLGELLVAAGLLTTEQVEQALRAQVLWGGRLGTNLVELHHLELDPLSKAIGRQHRLPAALARHFEKADPELQQRLSPEIAERFSCIPLLTMGPEQHVVIAALAPLAARQLAIIADELAVEVRRLVPAIAAELRIRYQLERVYRIRRAARFLRARGKSIPPFPAFPRLAVQPEAEADPAAPSLPTSTGEMAVYRPDPETREASERRIRLRTAPLIDRATTERDPEPIGSAAEATPGAATEGTTAAAAEGTTGPATEAAAARATTGAAPMRASAASIGAAIDAAFDAAIDSAVDGAVDGAVDDALDAATHGPTDGAPADTQDDLFPVEVDAATRDEEDGGEIADLSSDAELADDDSADDAVEPEDEAAARERRHYVRTIADAPSTESERQTLARIAIRKVAVGSAPRMMAGVTLGEATRAIRRSTGRDRVAELVIDTLDRFAPACEAAILLVIRGATAIGWKGFQRGGAGLGEIAVPMDASGMVPRAAELNVTLRETSGELAEIDRLLLASLGRSDGDLVVVPISIAEQVMCVIAIATAESAPVACAEPIAAAAGAAFARLMRDASR